MVLKIDPEFKSLIPALTPEEYAGLEESILKEGCRDALVVWNDVIVDGHNRYEICQKHGIEFKTVEKTFTDRDEIKTWIIRNQLARRNLSSSQKAMLFSLIPEKKEASAAKERQLSGLKQYNTAKEIIPERIDKGQARDKAAKTAGTNPHYVTDAKKIHEEAPDLETEIIAGRMSIPKAKRELTRRNKKQAPLLPSDKYRVVYADPPWTYGNAGVIGDTDNYGHVGRHYPSMTIKELCELPVKDMIEDNAVLFLWVTSPLLAECWPVIKAWGFEYKTSFVWDKVGHNYGHYNSVRHELLLICTRGSCTPDNTKLYDSVQTIEKSDIHSQKPEEFRHIIDDLYTHGKRIELFAREIADGWETWGNEL